LETTLLESRVLELIKSDLEVQRHAVLFRVQTGTYEICKPPEGRQMMALREAVGFIGNVKLSEIRFSTGRFVTSGLDGAGGSDLYGLLRKNGLPTDGRTVALEVKRTKGGRTSDAQKRFLATIRGNGGFGAVVCSVEEARAAIKRAMSGLSDLTHGKRRSRRHQREKAGILGRALCRRTRVEGVSDLVDTAGRLLRLQRQDD
jgi:hypothetical protein